MFYMTIYILAERVTIFCTLLSIVIIYGADKLTADRVFVIVPFLIIASNITSTMFIREFAEIGEMLVSLRRIQTFLISDENQSQKFDKQQKEENCGEIHTVKYIYSY